MSEIYLIRHAQASFGAEDYDRLSERGVHQAGVLEDHLARLNLSFDAIYFGEMDRHRKTAQRVMDAQKEKGLPVPEPILDPAFNEYDTESIWDAQIEQLLEKEPDILSEIDKDPKNNRAFLFLSPPPRSCGCRFNSRLSDSGYLYKIANSYVYHLVT